jgi:hypothetical protein
MSISPDLGRYFYSQTKVVEVTGCASESGNKVWVFPRIAVPGGDSRTYSLLTNRFADHTSLYVRVEDDASQYRLCHLLARTRYRL